MDIIGVNHTSIPATLDVAVTATRANNLLHFDVVTINSLIEDQTSDQYRSESSTTVDINVLRARLDWTDYQVYCLALQNGQFVDLFALYPSTQDGQIPPVDYARANNLNVIISINVPFANSSDDELFVIANLSTDAQPTKLVSTGFNQIWSSVNTAVTERLLRFPVINATAPGSMAVDTASPVQVRIEDASGTLIQRDAVVYIQQISGFSGGTQVFLTNGTGNFPISSAGMLPGDTIRMKLGWKYYSGIEDITVPVV